MFGVSMNRLQTVERLVNGVWEQATVQLLQKGDRIRLTNDTPDNKEITVCDNTLITLAGDFMVPMKVTMGAGE
ncbi:hypothetical protein M3_0139 [Lysinibacillus phage vB_LfM_LysYB1]|nr:hypothetical protein M3_0139 [Lysinibacillus phage vB_LfM_LysYB1]WAB25350.1 hypothetical protein M5_0172 [Lysinibacillus phage vB_LfM_LysYB2]